jgi:hypothetical protein
MNTLIVLAGLPRFSDQTRGSFRNHILKPFQAMSDVYVSISCYEEHLDAWKKVDLGAETQFGVSDASKTYKDSIFAEGPLEYSVGYFHQYNNLYWAHRNAIAFGIPFDNVLKTRLDFLYTSDFPTELSDDPSAIHIPAIEFHQTDPFDPDLICNDQLLFGNARFMKTYFGMVYDREFPLGSFQHGPNLGIERILREYLRFRNVPINPFIGFRYLKEW